MTTEFPTYASPGVTTSEIDLSGPSSAMPVGVPAGVIGTADEGSAYVPITVGTYDDFARIFGPTDGEKFGPLAVSQWFKNAQSCTYLRILGVGDGKKRSTTTGEVTNAGFVVGSEIIQENGLVGTNKKAFSVKAGTTTTAAQDGLLGRTYFLGAFHSQSAGSTIFSDAGLQAPATQVTRPGPVTGSSIIRAVLLAASGVTLTLSGNFVRGSDGGADDGQNTPVAGISATTAGPYGAMTGSVNVGNQEFVMLLNGQINDPSSAAPNVITASFDMTKNNYLSKVFNKDPLKLQTKGHVLYSSFDIHPDFYALTGSGILSESRGGLAPPDRGGLTGDMEDVAFLTTGSAARNSYSSTSPNYEAFRDRFTIAATPWITSQKFGGSGQKLFRVHSVDDGTQPDRTSTAESGRRRVKISIEGLKRNSSTTSDFGTFDLIVRDFADNDRLPVPLEQFRGLSLDPGSDRFIARVIGDQNAFYDFDKNPTSQRLVVDGDFPVKSNFIRIEQSVNLKAGEVPDEALPTGCDGPSHLITSGSGPLTTVSVVGATGSNFIAEGETWLYVGKRSVEPPIPYRESLAIGTDPNKTALASLYWGVQWIQKTSVTQPNKPGEMNKSIFAFSKYYPSYHPSNFNFVEGNNVGKADVAGTVRDCNQFNNNEFNLEKIRVVTGSDTLANVDMWVSASYRRAGSIAVDPANKYRAWKTADLDNVGNRKYAKFNVLLQGGFDGTDIFNEDKTLFLNAAAKREMDDSTNQGGLEGSTVAAFRKAVDIMGEKSDVDIKLLTIPGIRHSAITDYAIDAIENRFDAMYIMDIEERDTVNAVITSSIQRTDVTNTVEAFLNRGLDTSFAAAYFPDVIMTDPTTLANVRVPPSVAVLGAFALNDAIGFPWFAPAGFTRGALSDVLFSTVRFNKTNMDDLYEADINPITSFPGSGLLVFGQKTLLAAQSSLDRVNVRRLLIDVRRSVRTIANSILFEPNREETLAKFSALVNPILQSIQEKQGVDRFKVIIDTTTTTQADVENNTLRGKIFLQPTRTAEFISLDFVVASAGNFENV